MKHFLFIVLLSMSFYCLGKEQYFDKWIVVTSIQKPTQQTRKKIDRYRTLAQLFGWHLLVIGDKKTPEWQLDNANYLSTSDQANLPYKLARLLPWNHYARKNMGYLYAIEHGAQIIYDTDDDNEPYGALDPLNDQEHLKEIISSHSSINIYNYFERPTVWPRGLPLPDISIGNDFTLSSPKAVKIGIEQGVVDREPDVDAIFRLTRNQEVYFAEQPACVLPIGTYCPFNSQNTFIHKDAFFTLYIPTTVSMRVADIWRGYFAQKLIGLLGMQVAFSGPNAIQDRNEHNLLRDFKDELDLYLKSGSLVAFLSQWQAASSQPEAMMLALYQDLASAGFIAQQEIELCTAWLADFKYVLEKNKQLQ